MCRNPRSAEDDWGGGKVASMAATSIGFLVKIMCGRTVAIRHETGHVQYSQKDIRHFCLLRLAEVLSYSPRSGKRPQFGLTFALSEVLRTLKVIKGKAEYATGADEMCSSELPIPSERSIGTRQEECGKVWETTAALKAKQCPASQGVTRPLCLSSDIDRYLHQVEEHHLP
ncbi:hypothetical protein AXG93_1335s1240 [Marchantia polymorpha subsp. ruderalis]|uniref:Uncharacterized protein n=1 Tax=Marchantia polymorpha subsp. ruderalis TaxID=1480154 RepID=A0A176W838_MARPO|nr:hypothetical protein AXG93_1335s1240 [Marchantia polymorpha subsp. ruderalis]